MISTGAKVGIGTLALLAAFTAGAMTARRATEKVIVTESAKSATVAVAEVATHAAVSDNHVTHWRDRKVTKPDGTVIETHDAIKQDAHRDESTKSTREVKLGTTETTRTVYRERAPAPPPRFIVSLAAGTLIPPSAVPSVVPGLPSRLVLSATVSVRVIGPVYAGLTAVSTGAILAGLSVAF